MRNVAFKVRVTGVVQGVWFRRWTHEEANRLGLCGWVRNEADGSVSALVSGPEPVVSEMLQAFWTGSADASVESVTKEPADPPDLSDFQILQ